MVVAITFLKLSDRIFKAILKQRSESVHKLTYPGPPRAVHFKFKLVLIFLLVSAHLTTHLVPYYEKAPNCKSMVSKMYKWLLF